MRVLAACSLGGTGHLQPLLPFLDAAHEGGHHTAAVGPPAMRSQVATAGHPFVVGDEPPEAAVSPIREQLPVLPSADAAVLANRELFGRLATDAMLPRMTRLLDDWHPDLVLRDPCEYSSAIAARRAGVGATQVAIGLATVEWSSIERAAAALVRHDPDIVDALRSSPYLSRLPASLDPSPFPDTRRYRIDVAAPGPLPDWWDGADAPLVYASFGTVLGHMASALHAYRTFVDAVVDLDVRILLTVGQTFDATTLGDVPPHVHVEAWVDQAAALADAGAVVSHGGSGTTFGALAAGLPVVAVPLFADQRVNAQALVGSGAGLAVTDLVLGDEATTAGAVRSLRDALGRVLADPVLGMRAREVGAEMASAPPVDQLLSELLAP